MGTFTYVDPATIHCMPGKCLVQIVEVLGGTTKGGLHIPEAYADHAGKDTFYGKLLQIGPPPQIKHFKSGRGPGWDVKPNSSGKIWPPEMMDEFKVGDLAVFPRDVPLVVVWQEQRYAICLLHEAICIIPADSFNPDDFEVVPWQPPKADNGESSVDDWLDEVEFGGE